MKPNLAQAYSHRATARLALRDPLGANEDATRAMSLDPEDPEPYIVLGRLFAAAGRFEEALGHFDRAVELAAASAGAYWWRGRFFRDSGEFERAIADFDTAAELSPAEASIYLDRAIARIQYRVDKGAARADLEEAISLAQDPKRPDIVDAAEAFLEQLDDW